MTRGTRGGAALFVAAAVWLTGGAVAAAAGECTLTVTVRGSGYETAEEAAVPLGVWLLDAGGPVAMAPVVDGTATLTHLACKVYEWRVGPFGARGGESAVYPLRRGQVDPRQSPVLPVAVPAVAPVTIVIRDTKGEPVDGSPFALLQRPDAGPETLFGYYGVTQGDRGALVTPWGSYEVRYSGALKLERVLVDGAPLDPAKGIVVRGAPLRIDLIVAPPANAVAPGSR